MREKLEALERNDVWVVVKLPVGANSLHSKWVFKTKLDADGELERFKDRLVACGNEQVNGKDYYFTFAAVIEMSSVKLILVLARKWRVPARHGDIPNAYVKAKKEAELRIFLRIPQWMTISPELLKALGVDSVDELQKALYGLKQAGHLWSELLHKRALVGKFFKELDCLSVKDPGLARKFLGMRVTYDDELRYDLDQEVTIQELLHDMGLEDARGVRTPIGEETNEVLEEDHELPKGHAPDGINVQRFQSLVGSLLWLARCTRPEIAYSVHRASRRTHCPTESDWKLAKRIARYLQGTKHLRLRMTGSETASEPLQLVGYSDADFAADKADRKSVTGGWVTAAGMAVAWFARKQGGVSLSTMEAEFTAASVIVTELLGIRELLGELRVGVVSPMSLKVDNQAALKQLQGEEASAKAKHIDVRIKFVGSYTKRGILEPAYLESGLMPAGLLTKVMPAPWLEELKALVGLH